MASSENGPSIPPPPRGLAILALVGPSMIWCAEYIGSGEVILAPRAGAILGVGALWVLLVAIFLKFWIGLCGARYTACTGEGMIDLFDRIPGPRHWVVWIVLVIQLVAAALSIGAVANAAGFFVGRLLHADPRICAWCVALASLVIAWNGGFNVLKAIMSFFVLLIVLGALYVAGRVFPSVGELLGGLSFTVPAVPDWAVRQGANQNPWQEILPLLGWAAGGFASQVWYSYWVLGAQYGAAAGRTYGQAADVPSLRRMGGESAGRIKGWCRVVYADATLALLVGLTVTGGFLIAGNGVLRPLEQVPQKNEVASVLAQVLATQWGAIGGTIYLVAGSAALMSTQLGQLAGWPRLLADCFRICVPGFNRRLSWKWQYRTFLILFFCTNMLIVFGMGKEPVGVIQLAAVLDGVLLTALQAIWVAIGLYFVLPRLVSGEAWPVVRPHWIFAVGLAAAAAVYGYLCVTQVPAVVRALFA